MKLEIDGKRKKPQKMPFSDRDLLMIVLPLFVERLLTLVVGLADTFVISYTGEAAVSGVSLVNQLNNVFLFVSTSLAAGGAVVTSQYIGNDDKEKAGESASQLLAVSTIIFAGFGLLMLIGRRGILRFLFGSVDADVMEACLIYLRITACSFPMIAIYDAGAALFRSRGQTGITMKVSAISNVINVAGNVIGVFVLKAGVAGVAWPSLIARTFSAIVITILGLKKASEAHYSFRYMFHFNGDMLGRILGIAVPGGVETGFFQLIKVALSSMISTFGTVHIAANGIGQTFWSLSNAFSNTGGAAYTTVIGQCMGDDNQEAAEYYFWHFARLLMVLGLVWNVVLTLSTPGIIYFFALSAETKRLILIVVVLHNAFNIWLGPYWNAAPNGLRACGDVRFTMKVTLICTVIVRLALSYVFGVMLALGVVGIILAMIADWVVRAAIYWLRIRSGKWKQFRVI